MSRAATLEKLYSRRRFGIRPGVGRVTELLGRLGNPQHNFRSIHVVGTNGKGSTAAFLSSILSAAGHRTGFFSSPHLVRFNERFRIDASEIDDSRLTPLLETVLSCAPPEATFFEITTALAAACFAESGVEIAVLEAGMGGISDATAALPGIMTVLTPVSFDHCNYLGATLEAIATEKCRIAEPGTPLITCTQPREAEQAIARQCLANGNHLLKVGETLRTEWMSDGTLSYHGLDRILSALTPGIPGRYQAGNAALALAAAETLAGLGIATDETAMEAGIRSARWPGRMERVEGSPPLLLDGAHNPAGAAALAAELAAAGYQRLFMVIGIMEDKDAAELLAPLAPFAARAFAVPPAVERAMDPAELAGRLGSLGVETTPCGSVAEGLAAARSASSPGDLVLVCGSLFTVGEAKALLEGSSYTGVRG